MRLQVSTGARFCNCEQSESRGRLGKTRRAHKQSHVALGSRGGGRAKSRRLFRQQRDGAAARDKYCAPATTQHSRSQDATRDPPQSLSPCECKDSRIHPGPAALHTSFSTLVPAACVLQHLPSAPHPQGKPGRFLTVSPSRPSVASTLGTMPFLGQDWRSPGQSWVKTADGWKRFLDEKSGSFVSDLSR